MEISFDQLIKQESGGRQFAANGTTLTSSAGAKGIAQVMPATAKDVVTKHMGMEWNSDTEAKYNSDPDFNRQIGETYFNSLKDKFKDPILATAAYNAGPGQVNKWLATYGDPRSGSLSHEAWTAKIPFKETRDYVLNVVGRGSDRPVDAPAQPDMSVSLADVPTGDITSLVNTPATDEYWENARAPVEHDFSAGDVVSALFEETNTAVTVTNALGKDWQFYQPENGWSDLEIKGATDGIPDEFHEQVLEAPNPFYERQAILQQLDNSQKIASLGWAAIPATFLATMLDPATIAAGVATEGLGSLALAGRRSVMASRLIKAGIGMSANVAQDAATQAIKPVSDWDSLLYSATIGAGLGFSFGHGKAKALEMENKALTDLANRTADHVAVKGEFIDPFDGSAGAAANPNMPRRLLSDIDNMPVDDPEFTAFGGLRWDATGQMRSSPNSVSRSLGEQLGVDAVGNKDANSVGQSFVASEKSNQLEKQMTVRWAESFKSNMDDYYKRNKIKPWDFAARRDGYNKVTEDAFQYHLGIKSADEVDKASVALSEKSKTLFADILKIARDPTDFLGRERPPLPGFEEVMDNPKYVPFMHDVRKWRDADLKYGAKQMDEFVYQGIKKALPEIEEAAGKRIAKGYLRTLAKVDAGMDIGYANALRGGDLEKLKQILTEEGLDDVDVDAMISLMTPKEKKGSNPATSRAKQRTPIEASHTAQMQNLQTGAVETVNFTDFLHKDMDYLVRSYTRNMSGAIALHGVEFRGADGELLLDGLSRKSDLDKAQRLLTANAREVQNAGEKLTPYKVKQDQENLQYFWEALKGIPVSGSNTRAMAAANTLKNLSFYRLMGNLGFAQMAEAGPIITTMGWKASLRTMPALRKLLSDVKAGTVSAEMMDEIKYTFGVGTEGLRHGAVHSFDDTGPIDGLYGRDTNWDGYFAKAENTTAKMANGLNKASLAPVVTNGLQRWASRALYYRLGQWMRDPKKVDKVLLKYMGIDDVMFKRIKSERSNFKEGQNGELVFNFDKWTDREAASALSTGIHRMSRKVIQENDVGMANRIFRKHPIIGRIIGQFRSFMGGAWTNHTLHTAHRALNKSGVDGAVFAFHAVSVNMMIASLPYIARSYGQSIGRSDQKEFLDKRLNPDAIGKAAFQNSSLSSIVPMLVDIPALGGHGLYDPIFSYRSSGLASNPVTGSPAGGLLSDAYTSVQNIGDAIKGDNEFSQPDARKLGSLFLPNLLPVTMLMNAAISGLPERDRSNR